MTLNNCLFVDAALEEVGIPSLQILPYFLGLALMVKSPKAVLTLSDPGGGPLGPPLSKSIANVFWTGISTLTPDGVSS